MSTYEWYLKHHADNETPAFVAYWLGTYGEPEIYEDEDEYWMRRAFGLMGWRDGRDEQRSAIQAAHDVMLKPGGDFRATWAGLRRLLGHPEDSDDKTLAEAAEGGVARAWVLLHLGQIEDSPDEGAVKLCARCCEPVPLRALFGRGGWWVCSDCVQAS